MDCRSEALGTSEEETLSHSSTVKSDMIENGIVKHRAQLNRGTVARWDSATMEECNSGPHLYVVDGCGSIANVEVNVTVVLRKTLTFKMCSDLAVIPISSSVSSKHQDEKNNHAIKDILSESGSEM
ncbi:hypothetical protein ACROYT_G029344 [Oculina patagonica]